MKPRLSLMIATHNQEGTLEQALRSALQQDLGPGHCEVIVVDDGSTDRTPEILRRYTAKLRLFPQPNRGLAAACNTGLAQARGEYFARLDSDDWAAPSWLRRLLDLLERHPEACGAYPDYTELREQDRTVFRPAREDNLYSLLACGTLFRTQSLQEVGGYRNLFWEEYDLYLRLRERWPLLHLPEPLYFVRKHPDSMTADASRRRQGWQELLRLWSAQQLRSAGSDPELEEAVAEAHAA